MDSTLTWDDYRTWLGPVWMQQGTVSGTAPALASMSTDTRSLKVGDWFVPLGGETFDGHKYLAEAVRKGAAGFFYDAARRADVPPDLLPLGVAVRDSLEAFQKAASGWRLSLKNLKIVALTGSAGKTTTKEMVGQILKKAGETLATQASFNNEIGVPKTLSMLRPDHKYAVVEMGARHKDNITFLCHMAHPDVAALINVGTAHVGEFGSIDNLLATKLEIFHDSAPEAVCIANADDPRIVKGARATGKRVVTFGRAADADVRIASEGTTAQGEMAVELSTKAGLVHLKFPVPHVAHPINAAAACAMALAAGALPEHVVAGLEGFSGIKGRFQVHARRDGLTIVDDTYNANPDSMRAGLTSLHRAFGTRELVLVLGDMLELGDTSEREHRDVGAAVAKLKGVSMLVTVGPSSDKILEGATAAGFPRARVQHYATVDDLLAARLPLRQYGEVVYAKASNGIKLSRFIDALLEKPT